METLENKLVAERVGEKEAAKSNMVICSVLEF